MVGFTQRTSASNARAITGAVALASVAGSADEDPLCRKQHYDPAHQERVAKAHGLSVKEMDNPRRDRRLAAPRHIAMYIAAELTDCSLPQIAHEFGKKDHTTVMYARDKVKDIMARDEAYRNKVRSLIALCQTE
jgi:chromosomal replication initiator protein